MMYQATDYLGYGRVLPFLHAINNAAILTKVALQCLPYIGYPPSLNAMGALRKPPNNNQKARTPLHSSKPCGGVLYLNAVIGW